MLTIVVPGTPTPAPDAAVTGYPISNNMSNTAHPGSGPTFYFHDYDTQQKAFDLNEKSKALF